MQAGGGRGVRNPRTRPFGYAGGSFPFISVHAESSWSDTFCR